MATLNRIVLCILILQMYVNAAPSDVSKLEDIAKVEQAEQESKLDPEPAANPKLDAESKEIETNKQKGPHTPTDSSPETQRQKRWYNPYGYGFPPMNPLIYSGFNKRDEGPNTGYYGGEDPLAQIHRRIQEIANIVRQPPPPPPPHIPIFYPVLFIPTSFCQCNPNPTQTDRPSTPENNTTPSIINRWPAIDDERQNWGILTNDSDDDDGGEEYSRPISFDPISLNKPVRPPPPVEHGTVQGSSDDNQVQTQFEVTTTIAPPPPPPQNAAPYPGSFQSSSPPIRRPTGLAPPSPCDGAILTCCHQAQVAYDCFAVQGCPDLSAYGNPCDPNLILTVIERFQMFYGQRGG